MPRCVDMRGYERGRHEWRPYGYLIRLAFGQPPFQGAADPFSLKTVHWTVFRALEPPEGKAIWRPYGQVRVGAFIERPRFDIHRQPPHDRRGGWMPLEDGNGPDVVE